MSSFPSEKLALVNDFTGKIALELVYAQPGKDVGLLPVNSILGQIEELFAGEAPPDRIREAVIFARKWIDQTFDTTAAFDADCLKRLSEWCQWMQQACECLQRNEAPHPVPSSWNAQAAAPSAGAGSGCAAAQPSVAPVAIEEPLMLNLDSDADLLREFTNESQEHLQNIEQGVLVLEDNPTDADTLNATFRAFHTFKGGSGFLNLTPIKNLAHELESMLDLARQHKLTINSNIIDIILNGGDTLKQFVTEIEHQLSGTKPPQAIIIPTQSLLVRIRLVLERQQEGGPSETPSQPVLEHNSGPVETSPLARLSSESPASKSSEPVEVATNVTPMPAASVSEQRVVKAPETATGTKQSVGASTASGGGASVKVDTLKLDSLVDLVGELVIAQSLVAQDGELARIQSQQLGRNLAQLGRITKELQRIAMSLRMVPIRATFQKMHRLVRDTAGKTGKQVELVMEGEETELDRTIVEEISDPLVHMIRNSLDHGIEKPDVRVSRGKQPQGTVILRAFYQGGNIVIEIQDDGAGLNKDRILQKAMEKGLVSPSDNLSEKEIFNLIFAAGFSTAEKITEISGRGVGMDVVRRNIEKLRGKIEITSTLGVGSTFTIYLPLTLAIIDGLIVGVGQERYILPTLSVSESFRPTQEMLSTVHGRGEMVNVRGRLCPLLRLHEFFDVTPKASGITDGIVVVVESGQDSRAVLVDQLIGKQEVVIKALGETFKANRALAGGAILGDGRVGLILDPEALVQLKFSPVQKAA